MPTRTAMLVLAAGALLGVIFTLLAGQEPGGLLGFFIIVGAIAAALGIQRGRVYLLFPAPALAFFVAAIVTGKVHDAKLGSSTAGLGAGFTQWVAGIFFPAVVATIIVVLVGGGRWLLGRQLITGQSTLSASRPAPGKARPAPRDRRPGVDSWAEDDPFCRPRAAPGQDRASPAGRSAPPGWAPRTGGARPARPPATSAPTATPGATPAARRPQPARRPRPAPAGNRPPPQATGPAPAGQRPGPPGSPAARPPAPARPLTPTDPRPQRPPRRPPPDGWA